MTAIILHPTEELKLITFQKEVINCLFDDDRILYSESPLWISLEDFDIADKKLIKKVELGDIEFSDNSIYVPLLIKKENGNIRSKLTLVNIYKGRAFNDSDIRKVAEKKQPVKELKIFRLGLVQEEGPHAKSISNSVWCKIK